MSAEESAASVSPVIRLRFSLPLIHSFTPLTTKVGHLEADAIRIAEERGVIVGRVFRINASRRSDNSRSDQRFRDSAYVCFGVNAQAQVMQTRRARRGCGRSRIGGTQHDTKVL